MKRTRTASATPQKRIRATVHDVALAANVSIATVSRALNAPETVRKELRDRVLTAASELNYSADSVGKALRLQRTHIVGTILPRLDDPLFAEVASGIQETLTARDYIGFIQTTGFDNRSLLRPARRMIDSGAEGLIVFGRIEDPALIDFAEKSDFPIISAYSFDETSNIPTVGFDNRRATQQLIELLLQFGHTRIAMISGTPEGNDRQSMRIQAFQDTLAQHGLHPVLEIIDMAFELPDGAAALRKIRAEHPEVTALVCNRDAMAFSVLSECKRQGINVPKQLSVTGFDDIDYAPLIDPPLTTVSVPATEIATAAAQSLIRWLDKGIRPGHVRFDTEVILRGSTGRAPS
jgi:LacI family transcriptional regulator